MSLLERRFDNVVFRLGLAPSRSAARQLILHGHFRINDRMVNVPSYSLRAGDLVTVKEKSKENVIIKDSADKTKGRPIASWLELDRAKPTPAIEHFRKAAAKAPEQAPWRADLYFQLAQAELLTGAKAFALVDFKKYLDIAPPDAPARHEATQQVARLGGGKK